MMHSAGLAGPSQSPPPMADGSPRKLISIVTPCFNEAGNVRAFYDAVRTQFAALPQYRYEHIFIDNDSSESARSCGR